MTTLLIIEPWCCHYEILPSLIHSTQHLYQNYVIYTPHMELAASSLSTMILNVRFVNQFQEVEQQFVDHDSFDLWINTSHVHGSRPSFFEQLERISRLSEYNQFRRIYVVLHNVHDLQWFMAMSSKSKLGPGSMKPVCLSHDVKFSLWQKSRLLPAIFTPYLLADHSSYSHNIAAQPSLANEEEIRLLIIGLCRSGKKFSSIRFFRDLIETKRVSFSYAGWVPKGSLRHSGLWDAVNSGFINHLRISNSRINDSQMNHMILDCDAIIDLKIPENGKRSYVSSGNIGAALAFARPLVAHRANYPGANCIRFVDYEDLFCQLSDFRTFRDDLLLHRFILQSQQSTCFTSNRLIFEY